VNILRRLPLSRLLLLCGVVVAVGIGATALALAVGTGPTPPPKPLAEAIHDSLSAPSVSGVSARIQFTNHLLEGANLASGDGGEANQLSSNPLISGASGRLWIGSNGHARLELQSEKGDTQILYDGHNVSLYDASTNTLYRYTPPAESGDAGDQGADAATGSDTSAATSSGAGTAPGSGAGTSSGASGSTSTEPSHDKIPTVAEIEEGIAHAGKHADISGATPTDVAGQAAYTVRVSPRENGGLIGGAELSWDAVHGIPLRAALYSTTSPSPVIELAATEISYGPVESSTLDFTPPANAKIEEVTLPTRHDSGTSDSSQGEKPHLSTHGQGLGAIELLESPVKPGEKESTSSELEGLPKVNINGTSASELPTPLGTLLSFERAGVRYVLAGSVTPASIEAFARGL
jgi:outer membrane lipoprotein-sorting protein